MTFVSQISQKIESYPLLKINLPYILVFLSQIIWPLSWIYNNQHKVNFIESTLCRGFLFTIFNFLVCKFLFSQVDIKDPSDLKYIILRSAIMIIHGFIMGFSQFVLPLPIVHTINSSGVVFTFITDYFVNGVQINRKQFIGIVIAILSLLVTVNNIYLYRIFNPNFEYETDFQNYITSDPKIRAIVGFLLILDNIIWSFGIIFTKRIKKVTPFHINFVFGILNIWSGAILLKSVQSETTLETLLLSCVYSSLPLVICAWMFVGALTLSKNSGTLTLFCLLPIAFSQLYSALVYKQSQNPFIFIGIAGICTGVYRAIMYKQNE